VPAITEKARKMKREGKIEEKLYNDALERKKRENMPIKSLEEPNRLNHISTRCLQNKFEREYNEATKDYQNLSFNEFSGLLKTFHCISSSLDEILVRQLWNLLEEDKCNGVNKDNLNKALRAILRIPMETSTSSSSFSSDSKVELGKSQCAYLRKTFSRFYLNRCNYEEDCSHNKEQYAFRPMIGDKSKRLAEATRIKGETVEEKLLQQHKMYEEWRMKQKQLKEEEELKCYCTFHPQIKILNPSIYKSSLLEAQKSAVEKFDPIQKSIQLFELSKTKKTPKSEAEEAPNNKTKGGVTMHKKAIKKDGAKSEDGLC